MVMLLLGSVGGSAGVGQRARTADRAGDALQQRYDAAQRAQASGDLGRAMREYQDFLAESLRRVAEGQARVGEYPASAKLFEEALAVAPAGSAVSLRLSYAEAALVARDIPKARALAEAVLVDEPKSAEARLVLGEALLQTNENEQARKELEAAVALEPNYRNGLALATAYLALADTKDAERIFTEMAASFGKKASVYLDFGRSLAEAGYPEMAIADFNLAIAKDSTLPEVHYCLGASYLLSEGEKGFAKAAQEFRRELALHPDDYFSLSQLGYIALNEHRLPEAEADLKRAAALDPRNPDNPLLLGQVYAQLNQPEQAEQALRMSIALTTDLSRNHYQVQRAHYLLGRLLLQTGHADEAKEQMQLSADLLKKNLERDEARLKGAPSSEATSAALQIHARGLAPVDVQAKHEIEAFAARVAPALADSYNNLGAIAAADNQFASATGYFEKAARWNPSLEGLDYNWGRAAFSAELYAQAEAPLGRYLAAHPLEQGARRVLGICYFKGKKYAATVETLLPIEGELAATPQLDSMYAQSLLMTGDYDGGVARLQRMSRANPAVAEVHRALGEAYASHGEYLKASEELRTAVQLNAADSEATDQLAMVLTHLEKKNAPVQR
ncbi:tetratricopeptide repeat protein [Granulicella arctica]|uniref:Tetratricopeptide (TPR) repeat protein n=1 Tax=Granulicella arctica TaxID=940613 RepID=A0A7Y9PDP8_9BACT|nr:tetratricopeptide repeat protein [Granulicella arctica]NYF78037.1 tetratricopeptide (TPR) repeat protein [Granulicella arctica]